MGAFERIVLIILTLGIWVLVLSPQDTGAHHEYYSHDCTISGSAFGEAHGVTPMESILKISLDAEIYQWGGVIVDCEH